MVSVEVETAAAPDPAAHDLRIDDRPPAGPGLVAERLATTEVYPVCRPGLQGLREPRDLERQVLLDVRDERRPAHRPSWARWLDEAGLGQRIDARAAHGCDDESAVLQAAIDGRGVALRGMAGLLSAQSASATARYGRGRRGRCLADTCLTVVCRGPA